MEEKTRAARKAAVLFDPLPRAFLSVQGKDRAAFLHNLLTHDIKGLPFQQGRPACLLDRQGRIRFATTVHARADEILLEMEPDEVRRAVEELSRYLVSEDVSIRDINPPARVLPLLGPESPAVLAKAWPGAALPETPLGGRPGPTGSGIREIIRRDLLRTPGFHLWIDPESEEAARGRILRAGEPLGLRRGDGDLFETLRIEAGLPGPKTELTESVILNELGREEMVSFTKGCYVGQEIVARIKYRAHPPRLLKGLVLEGPSVPSKGSAVRSAEGTVGEITSACWSPTLQRPIALCFLKHGTPSENLTVETPRVRAVLAELPFVR